MGRADDKEGEALSSEADDDKDKDYSDKDASDAEDLAIESKKKYKCTEPGCTARFLRPSRLTWHLRKHNDERPYKCSIKGCTRAYTNSSHLKRHENTHKPVTTTYTCSECLLEVGSLFSLKRHCKMIHDPKRLTCADCGAKFRKKHCYNEHLSMHAGISMYKCEVCQVECPTLRLLKKHQLSHDKKKTYTCKAAGCTKVFDKWSKLAKHVETEHQFDRQCDKCDKTFKTKRQLKAHSSIHINEDIFSPCPYPNCPRFYAHERNLTEHIQSFHEGRTFTCDTCKCGLTSKASLIRHIKKLHESPTEKRPKRSNRLRRRRKDAGLAKTSMAVRLSGIKIPLELEKEILKRKPRIDLKNPAEEPESSKSKNQMNSKDIEPSKEGSIFEKDLSKEMKTRINNCTQCYVYLGKKLELETILKSKEINVKNTFPEPTIVTGIVRKKKKLEDGSSQATLVETMQGDIINVENNSSNSAIARSMGEEKLNAENRSPEPDVSEETKEERTRGKNDSSPRTIAGTMENEKINVQNNFLKPVTAEVMADEITNVQNNFSKPVPAETMEEEIMDVEKNFSQSVTAETMEEEIMNFDNYSKSITDEVIGEERTNKKDNYCVPELTEEELLSSVDCLLKSGKLIVLEKDSEEISEVDEDISEMSLLADQLLHDDENFVTDSIVEQPLVVYEETNVNDSTNDSTNDSSKTEQIEIFIQPIDASCKLPDQIFPINSETDFQEFLERAGNLRVEKTNRKL